MKKYLFKIFTLIIFVVIAACLIILFNKVSTNNYLIEQLAIENTEKSKTNKITAHTIENLNSRIIKLESQIKTTKQAHTPTRYDETPIALDYLNTRVKNLEDIVGEPTNHDKLFKGDIDKRLKKIESKLNVK